MANPVHEDDRKLFVGALPQEAKDSDIKEYFGQFGEIENINLKMDPMTGRSRYRL
jgi:RNA recognition motif-containing protein